MNYEDKLKELSDRATERFWLQSNAASDALVTPAAPDEEAAVTVHYYGGWPVLESCETPNLELIAFQRNSAGPVAEFVALAREVIESAPPTWHPRFAAALAALDATLAVPAQSSSQES